MIRLFSIFIFLFSLRFLSAVPLDSLNFLVQKGSDNQKKEALKILIDHYQDIDSTKCFYYLRELYNLGEESNDIETIAQAYLLEGHFYKKRGDLQQAVVKIKAAIDLLISFSNTDLLGKAYSDMGAVLVDRGYYPQAAEYLTKAVKIFDNQNNQLQLSKVLLNLGLVFYYQKNYPLALSYYDKSLKIRQQLKDSSGIALLWNNMGIVYYCQGRKNEAIQSFIKALNIYRKRESFRQMSMPLFNLGEIFFENNQYDSALNYFKQSYAIDTMLQDQAASTKSLIKLAITYASLNNNNKAIELAKTALKSAIAIDSKEDIKDAYLTLAEIYKHIKDFRQAYEYLDKANQIKDTIYISSVAQQVAELQLKYETEKKDLLLQQQMATIAHQKMITLILAGAILAVLAFLVFGLIEYIQKRKAFKVLEIQKKNITDSINYASKIQSALLPPEQLMHSLLPECFVLYLPKEVVSGDFYWISSTEERIYIALADCTGHGVPGAFMSMLGFAYLNEIVTRDPSIRANVVLELLSLKVKESLHQHENSESKDGMDIAMVVYTPSDFKIEYAGANIPLIICRNGSLIYLPPNKMPIGFQFQDEHSFSLTTVYLQPNDIIYLSSDGYSDQFGGNSMKKLGKARFEQILAEASLMPIKAQKYYLEEKFLEWQNEMEQIDDISILGFRLN
ncbi:MAG: tetratricopeptide repeat protein [Bacteroidales bacterium]|nr:tetratricopeptide repeat protein [Bacteroidales bacterium]